MGVSSSVSIADLDSNESLTRLVGDERIEEGLSFWDELLSFYFTVPENRCRQSDACDVVMRGLEVVLCVEEMREFWKRRLEGCVRE